MASRYTPVERDAMRVGRPIGVIEGDRVPTIINDNTAYSYDIIREMGFTKTGYEDMIKACALVADKLAAQQHEDMLSQMTNRENKINEDFAILIQNCNVGTVKTNPNTEFMNSFSVQSASDNDFVYRVGQLYQGKREYSSIEEMTGSDLSHKFDNVEDSLMRGVISDYSKDMVVFGNLSFNRTAEAMEFTINTVIDANTSRYNELRTVAEIVEIGESIGIRTQKLIAANANVTVDFEDMNGLHSISFSDYSMQPSPMNASQLPPSYILDIQDVRDRSLDDV